MREALVCNNGECGGECYRCRLWAVCKELERAKSALALVASLVDGVGDHDLHEAASVVAYERGKDEPDDDDYAEALMRIAEDVAVAGKGDAQ